ncbi:unnamed protein product [Caretta caretta]
MAMLFKPDKVEIRHPRKTHTFALLKLSDPKNNLLGSDFLSRQGCVIGMANQLLWFTTGQEMDSSLVIVPECGMVSPVEGPEPDGYNLDKLLAEQTLRSELQVLSHKHADAFARHKDDGPLYQLLKKSVQQEWTEQHTEAVSQLKQAIVKALVLINPNPEIPCYLAVSAPKRGMGRSDPRPKPHV